MTAAGLLLVDRLLGVVQVQRGAERDRVVRLLTSPSSPGLSTRIEVTVLVGFTWTAVASASAFW